MIAGSARRGVVLDLWRRGYSARRIAAAAGCSRRTVGRELDGPRARRRVVLQRERERPSVAAGERGVALMAARKRRPARWTREHRRLRAVAVAVLLTRPHARPPHVAAAVGRAPRTVQRWVASLGAVSCATYGRSLADDGFDLLVDGRSLAEVLRSLGDEPLRLAIAARRREAARQLEAARHHMRAARHTRALWAPGGRLGAHATPAFRAEVAEVADPARTNAALLLRLLRVERATAPADAAALAVELLAAS